jgi:diacylglycerol diphosphate phosphatase/phosphatidate phosphatase
MNHPPTEFFGLATWAVCTQTDKLIMRDGWRSFWSGHASGMSIRLVTCYIVYDPVIMIGAFAGLSFLSYYMAGKLHMFDEQGYTVRICVMTIFLSTYLRVVF